MKTPFWPTAGPGTITAFEQAAELLRNHDVTVEDVDFPPEFNDATLLERTFEVVMTVEAHTSYLKEYRMDTTKTMLHQEIRALVEKALLIPHKEVRQAHDHLVLLRVALDQVATKYTTLITPSAADEATLGLGYMGAADFNFVWTAARKPVINVPAFPGPNGMPVGLSLVSRRFCDQHLLSIARVLSGPLIGHDCV